MRAAPRFDVVVPTIGRPSLGGLLQALSGSMGPPPGRLVVVDDRRYVSAALWPGDIALPRNTQVLTLRSGGRGPAAARNAGWRACGAHWVCFLDDDVLPPPGWLQDLSDDLRALPPSVAGSQGNIRVPLPGHRPPTDWERNVKGLERARWATADMAYRRSVLREVGGFDERFSRAFREDADLGLRIVRAGYSIEWGGRWVSHPVRPADHWVSVRLQAGNADDALMAALHGRGWRRTAGAPAGRRPSHIATTAAGAVALAGLLAGRKRLASLAATGWLAGTAEFAWARIRPGPRTGPEIRAMLLTSIVIPAAATFHWLHGMARRRALLADTARAPHPHAPRAATPSQPASRPDPPHAVLFDRDGTLVRDVPYNGDPRKVVPMPGAREALDRLRAAGLPLAVVSNQSGVARGLLTMEQVQAVNRRVEELLGPLDAFLVCPHGVDGDCRCRKPAPGLILRAAAVLGVEPARCAVVGDIGSDMEAARVAGARGVLVPSRATRQEEVAAAPEVAADLVQAVELLIGSGR